eukprot:CAMPEP_0170385268 /NCGR_PEP_ID=MMETSP0117_2-20130122/16425_1 /TAXON_ID=400756 /ORGANISM="Durinskia baltica, Strain CSIRO CS-38" /LENGTH=703 /DNA_ID=CAMNT_0010641041 /DNA_START=30 /DNA_END=2141 /DNA_ORIENTATION=-
MTTNPDVPISVEEAILRVLMHSSALGCESLPLSPALLGRIAGEDVVAKENFPPFAASIMDGFAVVGPLQPGTYPIMESIHAGATPQLILAPESVSYITTGAALPPGASAVVKVEDTETMPGTKEVKIKVPVADGQHIRQIGSDVACGETVIRKGQVLGPYELGVLATTGFPVVKVFRKPIVGVMSTGNELVDSCATPTGSQVRDCNRLSLISSCHELGQEVIDLGIVSDSKEELHRRLLEAAKHCDIVVSSGGVSMGAADFVKPLLREIGTVHFAKLNMKPGKPTTFASFEHADGSARKKTLFFGLPGNPVSCLVTKSLFVDTAVKRLQGLDSEACLHPQLTVSLAGGSIKLDPERPEYHRAILVNSVDGSGRVLAYSTGNQRSSRILSMLSANALLFLPKGPGVIAEGTVVQALLIRPLTAALKAQSVHARAALLDFADEEEVQQRTTSTTNPSTTSSSALPLHGADYVSFPRKQDAPVAVVAAAATAITAAAASVLDTDAQGDQSDWRNIRVGLLTISDRAHKGVYDDASGPEMARLLKEMSAASDFSLNMLIRATAVVPDERGAIERVVSQWSDPSSSEAVDLILTSGGTGFGVRDLTPEAIKPLLHREAPGVAQALLNEGLKHTPLAVLSRPVVGTRFATFICTLPGSVKAVRENIVVLKTLLPRIMELIKEGECSGHPPPSTNPDPSSNPSSNHPVLK